jgi:membrane-associated phospholipid phosphatase
MAPRSIRISWEHNHSLALPIRAGHAIWWLWSPVHRWAGADRRRAWALPGLYGLIGVLALWPLDAWAMGVVTAGGARTSLPIGGDIRRELEALQQFGQGGMTILVALAIWLLDPPNRRRLLDWLGAVGVAAVLAFGLKMLLGRPRPVLDEPDLLLGPLGMHPLPTDDGLIVTHAWAFWQEGAGKLWSMPSSHTVFAVVAAAMLAGWYPRLRWLMIVMAGLVALSRVAFGAHYPSDVAAGVAVGLMAVGFARRWVLSRPRA